MSRPDRRGKKSASGRVRRKKQGAGDRKPPRSVRVVAARILNRWKSLEPARRPPINIMIQEAAARELGHNPPNDRALLGEIVTGSVRWLRLLDRIVCSRLDKPGKIPPEVRAILFTACYQLIFLDRIPPFAAVNEAVTAARQCGAGWASGLVNAVLRRILRAYQAHGMEGIVSHAAKRARDSAERMAIQESFPNWIVRRWIERHGLETAVSMCRASNAPPHFTLRVNRLASGRGEAEALLAGHGIAAARSELAPDALVLENFRGNPSRIPGFEKGWFQVQDESAQLVSLLLQPEPGQSILDACAGVGGKTTHIAELAQDRASIDAWDSDRARLGLLRENAVRLGTGSISVLEESSFARLKSEGKPVYDRILVDAPCSGLGVIRRHPDIKWNRMPEDVPRLAELQKEILEDVAPLLKPGGLLVYSVCTTEPEEGVGVVDEFVASRHGWQIEPAGSVLSWLPASLFNTRGMLRIVPGAATADGFFAALLRKIS